jgi:hypothetical protein
MQKGQLGFWPIAGARTQNLNHRPVLLVHTQTTTDESSNLVARTVDTTHTRIDGLNSVARTNRPTHTNIETVKTKRKPETYRDPRRKMAVMEKLHT